jgi:hypothetical protein
MGKPIEHRVTVALDIDTVTDLRAQGEELDLHPDFHRLLALGAREPNWVADVTFSIGAHGTICTALNVRSLKGDALTPGRLRDVRYAQVIDDALTTLQWLRPGAAARPVRSGAQRGRPREYTDSFYAQVANVYMAAVKSGQRPVRAVAEAFSGEPHPTVEGETFGDLTVRHETRPRAWVSAARNLGFITEERTGAA